MSRPGNPDAAEPGQARQYRAPAGLLEKLMAAVRPEFRAGTWSSTAGPGLRRAAVRGERL